jgi:hypothetical protein
MVIISIISTTEAYNHSKCPMAFIMAFIMVFIMAYIMVFILIIPAFIDID